VVQKLVRREAIDKEDVVALTRYWLPLADGIANGATTDLDREFAGHLKFVFNQILQRIRETGYSAETAEKAGKMLWRLYNVYMAFRAKGRTYEGADFLKELAKLVEEAK
jgi:hypothetical protein